MGDRGIGVTVMRGDTVRFEISVLTFAHVQQIRATFTRNISGIRGKSHLRTLGDVHEYEVGAAGRVSTAGMVLDTSVLDPMQTGEHLLEQLEVFTADERWLQIEEHPTIYIDIEPEPQDDKPVFDSIVFRDPL